MDDMIKPEDVRINVMDQRIGMGVGGLDTIIVLYHLPTGIRIEVPRITSSKYYDREIAVQMLETAITHPEYRETE